MLKKFSLILAVSLAAVLIFGCAVDNGFVGGVTYPVDLAPFDVVMEDNYEWGEGYQGQLTRAVFNRAFTPRVFAVGSVITIDMAFTVSGVAWDPDEDEDLMILFVDTSQAAGWWKELSDEEEVADADALEDAGTIKPITAQVELEITEEFVSWDHVILALQFDSDRGEREVAGSGSAGVRTLKFTKFLVDVK